MELRQWMAAKLELFSITSIISPCSIISLALITSLISITPIGSSAAFAATPFKKSLSEKQDAYVHDGLFLGGNAGSGSSILGVRRLFSQKIQLERIIVDLGDEDGRPAIKKMGYFQASIDAKQKRVVLDLAQLRLSMVSEQQIKQLFKTSPYVASIEFTLDPEDKAGSLVLNLKQAMRLEVFELPNNKKSARLIMDLVPIKK